MQRTPLLRPTRAGMARAGMARAIARLEERLRIQRELLFHPRLELAAARQMAVTARQIRRLRGTAQR